MNEFKNLKGFDQWNRKLRKMLAEAKKLGGQEDLTARFDMTDRLTEFILESCPNDEAIRELDDLANATREGLLKSTIEERVAAISARTGDLAALTKKIEARTKQNEADAATIRGAGITKAAGVLSSSVATLRELRALYDPSDKDDRTKLEKLDALVKAVQTFRNDLETDGSTKPTAPKKAKTPAKKAATQKKAKTPAKKAATQKKAK